MPIEEESSTSVSHQKTATHGHTSTNRVNTSTQSLTSASLMAITSFTLLTKPPGSCQITSSSQTATKRPLLRIRNTPKASQLDILERFAYNLARLGITQTDPNTNASRSMMEKPTPVTLSTLITQTSGTQCSPQSPRVTGFMLNSLDLNFLRKSTNHSNIASKGEPYQEKYYD